MLDKVRLWVAFNLMYLPPNLFLIMGHRGDFTEAAAPGVFYAAGAASVLHAFVIRWRRIEVDRLVLGMNFFFVVGAVVYAVGWAPLIREAGPVWNNPDRPVMFLCVMLVGAVASYRSKTGFIGLADLERSVRARADRRLLAATGLAVVFSWIHRNDINWGAIVPFAGLFLFRAYLRWQVTRAAKEEVSDPAPALPAAGSEAA